MTVSETTSTNPWLSGNFRPVSEETTATDLPVEGRIPAELEGRLLRNGANPIGPVDPETHHWFMGDGMVHGVRLRYGRAEWYRNRWVRGPAVTAGLGEPDLPGPRTLNEFSANTSVIGFAGRTLALVEAGLTPVELDYELNSVARFDFDATLPCAFTAHPKLDPVTGELHAVCYWWPDRAGAVQYVVVGTDGLVRRCVDVPVPGMPLVHDMGLTARYAVILDLPVTVSLELVMAGDTFPVAWNPDYQPRVGLLPRDGTGDDVIWCDVESGFVFHPLNAYDAPDGTVVFDVCRYETMFDRSRIGPDHVPTLDRWTIDPVSGKVTEEKISDRAQEFPRVAPEVVGRPHRYGYTASLVSGFLPGPTLRHDLATGTTAEHDHGPGRFATEPVPVTRHGGGEGDEWVLSVVYDAGTDRSELVVLDGADFTGPPVARVFLPRRVPFGFHGDWVPDAVAGPGS
ncbi:MAG: carotenoid oxygenase family protein [Acidimicrobiia bacterium]